MGISFRAFFIGLLAAVAACLIVSYAELSITYIQIGLLQLPPVVVGLFVFVLLASACGARIRKSLGLTPQELMTVYCMMLFSAMISSRGLLERLIPLLVGPAYFANPGNKWTELYFPHIKKWMVPFDPTNADPNNPQLVAKRFFEGLRGGETIPWHQWLGPLAMWGLLALLVFGSFMCLASIIRKQWEDNEKLTFPLAQLPLDIVRSERDGGLLRNKLTWFGFAVPAVVFTINGLHGLYPSIPYLTLDIDLSTFAVNPPLNAIWYTPMKISFASIGFFFLLPAEILFSMWFFFLMTRVQHVVAAMYGMDAPMMGTFPAKVFIGYQAMGAYFVLAAYLFYVGFPHLKMVVRSAFHIEKVDESKELLTYRTAFFGLIICVLGSALWLKMAGMSAAMALFAIGIYVFIVSLVMARSTAEAGMLMTETTFRPTEVYKMLAPVHTLGAGNMTVLAFADMGFFRDLRGLTLTGFLDGLRIADGVKIKRRSFLPVFIVSILVAMLVGGAFQIWLPYAKGGNTLYHYIYQDIPQLGFGDYTSAMTGPVPGHTWQEPTFFVVGALVCAFLAYMRYTFFWWPLHPLGYVLCASYSMIVFWFPCLVAWVLKSLVMRYGGMRAYVRMRPFFLGMVLGEFFMAVTWTVVSWATGAPAPAFPW